MRKAFEAARNAVAIGIYDDPPGREEIATALAAAGLGPVDRAAMGDLEDLARGLGPGDFAQFLAKLALYKSGDSAPLGAADMAACAPRATEADLDDLLDLVAEGQADRLAVELRRAGTQGSAPVALAIAAGRRFRTLLVAATAAEGPEAALSRVRPPVFGPRRTRLAAQARGFGAERLETALSMITETDLALRSGGAMPGLAMVERLFVRVAMLRPR
jgi:DNA polymerase-3 subunit delta